MDEGLLGKREGTGLCEEPGAKEPTQLLQGLKGHPAREETQWGRWGVPLARQAGSGLWALWSGASTGFEGL